MLICIYIEGGEGILIGDPLVHPKGKRVPSTRGSGHRPYKNSLNDYTIYIKYIQTIPINVK